MMTDDVLSEVQAITGFKYKFTGTQAKVQYTQMQAVQHTVIQDNSVQSTHYSDQNFKPWG